MNEVTFEVENRVLVIKVPIGAGFDKPSSTGKTQLVASTGGFKDIECGVSVNLTIIRTIEKKKK